MNHTLDMNIDHLPHKGIVSFKEYTCGIQSDSLKKTDQWMQWINAEVYVHVQMPLHMLLTIHKQNTSKEIYNIQLVRLGESKCTFSSCYMWLDIYIYMNILWTV